MTTETIHTCSYSCERPGCIRAQRDELVARLTAAMSQPAEAQAQGGGEVLERLRGVLEHGKMGDKCLIAPDLVTAAIAALSAPPPAAARGDVRGLVDKLVDAAYQDGMQELDAMSNETLSARSALEQALAQQPAAVDRARFRKAPCYLCGYNGPGYFQPDTHPCAAKYHATQDQEPTT